MPLALRILATLALSAAGGLALALTDFPAAILTGGAVLVAVATLAGFPALVPDRLRDAIFVLVGLTMGASVSSDTMALIAQWPITLTVLAIELVIIVAVCGYLLRRYFGHDRGTAYLSSFPGHLSFIVAIATAGVGDPRQIVVIQVLRVMILTLCVPIGALFLPVGDYIGIDAQDPMAMTTLVMVTAGCIFSGWVFTRLRVPAGYVLGSMAFATIMRLTGNFDGALPPIVVDLTFIAMGALIGARFAGISRSELKKGALGGLLTTAVTIAIVTVIAYGLTFIVDMPFGLLWLGLAPGGLESMGALGIALGYDTAFIAAHHVARLLMLTLAIPTVALLVRGRD